MGGYGSGQWQSNWAKDTIESAKCLDIFRLKEIGVPLGRRYASGELNWGTSNRISYELRATEIILDYRFSSGQHEGLALRYSIALVTTRPYYGGLRYWFVCPTCQRRAGKLYLAGKRFECRRCSNLAYESTRAGQRDMLRMIEASDRRILRSAAKGGEESVEFVLSQLGAMVAQQRYFNKRRKL